MRCFFVEGVWCEVGGLSEGGFQVCGEVTLNRGTRCGTKEKRETSVLVLLFWDRVVAVKWRIGGVGDTLEF